MSETSNENRNKPLRDGGQYRMLSIWLLAFFVLFSLLYYASGEVPKPLELTMREVVEEAQLGAESHIVKGAVLKVSPKIAQKWHEIQGKIRRDGEDLAFVARGQLTDANLEVLQQSGLFVEQPANSLLSDLLLTMLPIVFIVLILYFLFVRQLRNAGRGAMNFGKSRARMLTRDREKITFKDVAGCDEAKEEVSEIIDFLRDPKKFQKVGGRIPKGVLLVGPPGTGKTLLGKAVAGEADVPFFSISGSDFVEMFVGVGAARVRDMFEQGRKNAPCIIFVDEIDAVGRQRGAGLGGGNDEREQTLNSLLVEMDGFDAHEGVIIMAATNRPDVLDSALLRPGRFDRQVVIDLPDLNGRDEILQVHAKKIKLAKEVDLSIVARNTPGLSGADLANLLNESALLAARHDKKEVDRHDIEEAREKIAYGRERRKLMDEDDKRMTAFHEAGHALVQAIIDDGHLPLHKVTIIPRGRALGMTMLLPKKDILGQSRKHLLNQVCCFMAGRIGEEVETGEYSNGASSDIKQATKIARHMVCDWGMSDLGPVAYGDSQDHVFLGRELARTQNFSEATSARIDETIAKIIRGQYERARKIVEEHRPALVQIAEALLEYETIEGIHVHEILQHGEIRTPVHTIRTLPPAAPDSATGQPEEKPDAVGPSLPDRPAPAPA
jgi:cell division protease FtsH